MARLDREDRAARYLAAMDALHTLLALQVPDLSVRSEPLCQLLGILNDEAHKVVRRHVPGEHAPGIVCANDFEED